MKPIIIIKEKNADDKFEMTEKELEVIIEQVYKQGFEDAKAQYQPKLNPSWNIRDAYGNTIPYYGGTTVTDPNTTRAILTSDTKLNGSPISNGI